jgi:diguanylate cyclase (GGDEF)-like protein/PAS domain S-box-containing protein
MQSEPLNSKLVASLTGLAKAPASERNNLQTSTLAVGRDLLTRIGNQSNLILDPDLDSYYTMSLVILRYPELLELVAAIGQQVKGQEGVMQPTAETLTQYLIYEGRLDANLQGLQSDHEEAYAAAGASLQGRLQPTQKHLAAAVEDFRHLARAVIKLGGTPEALALAQSAQAKLIYALRDSWGAGTAALDTLLEKRIEGFFRRMWLHLGTALALLFTILGTVTFVARQIASPLRHLADVMDEIRTTGDHTRRAHWQSSDEIGRLVAGFNEMLVQLDHERETQKELAASARAADAQRALMEATPIPLVVTLIPSHDVLHANPPAEAWLNGSSSDPWKWGLDSAVRARFFQRLADHGQVDEFEVRWGSGQEQTWAVLSARRVRYQEQDAVLTAFTPINHLKLLERRLELWAKVFEASREGILIIDASQRILTANEAYSHHTGYELHEVTGKRWSMMLAADDESGVPENLWQAVADRGTWQGEIQVRRRDFTEYPAWMIVSAVRQSNGEVSHYILTSIDISDRKKSEQRIRFLAEHDVLTELPNRSLCTERLRIAVLQAQRFGTLVAVLFIDLDRFKDINDSLGHHIGDGLLRSVARRLTGIVRAGDTVSRLGGDEFVIVINGVRDIEEVTLMVEQRLLPVIREPHLVEGTELHISCSIGIAVCPDDGADIDILMRHADTAMYQAKAAGKDGAQFFTAEMTEQTQARIRLDANLRHALEHQQFELYYQPRVDAGTGLLRGVEALIRWHHPELGLVAPVDFIPRAEEIGLIVPIGAWVIDEACRQIAVWRRQGLDHIGVSINVSARQLRHGGLIDEVRTAMERHGIGPGVIELELTESLVMDDAEGNLTMMHGLRELGVTLSVDDFGTGYSCLAYLNKLPIDKLKVDRSFVRDMLDDPTDLAVTTAIIGLGHILGLTVVAEGVELEGQAALLREAHCDELQGYLFAQPMPADSLLQWAGQRRLHAA